MPERKHPSFSEMMDKIKDRNDKKLEDMRRIAKCDKSFALAVEVIDGCWDSLVSLDQIESMTTHSGKVVSCDDILEEIKEAMRLTFKLATDRDYEPAFPGRYVKMQPDSEAI